MHSGCFELDLSSPLGYGLRIDITPWSNGIHWRYIHGQTAVELTADNPNPGITLAAILNTANHLAWLESIPQTVLNQALVFEQRFGHGLSALSLASHNANLRRMLQFSPFLLWHLLEYGEQQRLNQQTLIALAELPRDQLLRRIGLPNALSTERLFRHHYNPINQTAKPLDITLLRWLREEPELLFAKFIEDDIEWPVTAIRNKVETLKQMGKQLQIHNIEQQIQYCANTKLLTQLYDRFQAKFLTFQQHRRELSRYLKPTFDIPANWHFIDSWQSLMEEACFVDRQISLYHPMILRGQYALFSVNEPERLTIGVSLEPGLVTIDRVWRRHQHTT